MLQEFSRRETPVSNIVYIPLHFLQVGRRYIWLLQTTFKITMSGPSYIAQNLLPLNKGSKPEKSSIITHKPGLPVEAASTWQASVPSTINIYTAPTSFLTLPHMDSLHRSHFYFSTTNKRETEQRRLGSHWCSPENVEILWGQRGQLALLFTFPSASIG